MSPLQRSLYSVAYLKAKPWWGLKETGHDKDFAMLTSHWKEIRREALANLDPSTGLYKSDEENLKEVGDWKQFVLFQRGIILFLKYTLIT